MSIMKTLYDKDYLHELYGASKQEEGRQEGRQENAEAVYQRAIHEFGLSEADARRLAYGS